jgi:hypothetical protein
MKALKSLAIIITAVLSLAACQQDAQIASHNIAKAADNFEIQRRIVFYNGISGEYILTIEGKCSLETGNPLRVTCKTGQNDYKKHYLGISDNVTWFGEQLESAKVSAYHYRVVFKPQSILPDVDVRGDTQLPIPTINR